MGYIPDLEAYSRIKGNNGLDTIEVDYGALIMGQISCKDNDEENTDCLDGKVDLGRTTLNAGVNGVWSAVATKHDDADFTTKPVSVSQTGLYTIQYFYKDADVVNGGCVATSDTVVIKPIKPLSAPILSIFTQCGATLEASAIVNSDSDPTDWQWVMSTADGDLAGILAGDKKGDLFGKSPWGFQMDPKSNAELKLKGDATAEALNARYITNATGKNSEFKIRNDAYDDGEGTVFLENNLTGSLFKKGVVDFLPSASNSNLAWGTSDMELNGKILAVRCMINGQWTPWSFDYINASASTNPYDASKFYMGISASRCVGVDVTNPAYGCSTTDTTVSVGAEVKLRLYLSGSWIEEQVQGIPQTTPFDGQSQVISNFDPAFNVIWQRREKEEDKWETFSVIGSFDDDTERETTNAGSKWYYVESDVIRVSQKMQYRAVFGRNGCFIATTDRDEGVYPGDKGHDECIFNGTTYGHFSDAAWINIKTDIITGKIQGSVDGSPWKDGPDVMCNTGTLNLRLQNNGLGDLQWEYSSTSASTGFVAVQGKTSTTFDDAGAYILAQSTTTDECMYKGCKGYFRVKVTDGGESDYTNVYEVTVYKPRKLYLDLYDLEAGDVLAKPVEVGLCDGMSVGVLMKIDNKTPDLEDLTNIVQDVDQEEGFQKSRFRMCVRVR